MRVVSGLKNTIGHNRSTTELRSPQAPTPHPKKKKNRLPVLSTRCSQALDSFHPLVKALSREKQQLRGKDLNCLGI